MPDKQSPTGAMAHRWMSVAALILVLLGGAVRLLGMDRRTIAHPEVYTPGIKLPREMVEFTASRMDLWEVLCKSVRADSHPPLYAMLMLAWTKVFGTDIFWLRLPSVLFSVASVPLVYAIGSREYGNATGLVASGMLALNGHHVYWSQQSRGYALACFLGLVSTLLLLKLIRGASRPLGVITAYCVITLAGLATEVFFWPIFVTQGLWVAGKCAQNGDAPSLLRWQLVVLLAASPLWAVAAHQSQIPTSASGEALPFLWEFLEFGFLLEKAHMMPLNAVVTAGTIVLPLVALGLLGVGLAAKREDQATGAPVLPDPPGWLMIAVEATALSMILMLGGGSYAWGGKRTSAILATALIPAAGPLLDRLLRRGWPVGRDQCLRKPISLAGRVSLSGLLSVLPVASIVAISPVMPVYASRGAMLFTPYLLVAAAGGLMILVRRDMRWLVVGLALVASGTLSVYRFNHGITSPRDYKALSEKLASRVRESDLIFVQGKSWQTTPIFYYLDSDHYRFVGSDYSQAVAQHPRARVWTLVWGTNNYMPRDMIAALEDYGPAETIEVLGAKAILNQRLK